MNVIIGSRVHQQKRKMPQSSQRKTNHDDAPRESRRGEKLANSQKVSDAGNDQSNEVSGRSNAARNSGTG
jgi:hypothetical protein